MKNQILLFILIPWTFNSIGQNCKEFQKHLTSIDSTYYPGHIIDRNDTVINANRAFVDYTVLNLLEKPSDKCFISNRRLLRKLKVIQCDSTKLIIQDTLKNGDLCKISISNKLFDTNNHVILYSDDSSTIDRIDGKQHYGSQYMLPKTEIDLFQIEINNTKLNTLSGSYNNFYNVNLCKKNIFVRPVEAYESLDGEYIYLYLYGGINADTYFSKLIFNKKEYLSKITSDYYSLSIHSSFRKSFIGY